MKLTKVSDSVYSEYDDYEGDIINTPDFVLEMRLSVPNNGKKLNPYIILMCGTQDERGDSDDVVVLTDEQAAAILAACVIE